MNDNDFVTVLRGLDTGPEPPLGLTAIDGVTAGRRRVRRRRVAASGAAVLTVCALVVAGIGLARTAGRPDAAASVPPAGARASSPIPTAVPEPAAPAAFDPRVRAIVPGYTPPGVLGTYEELGRSSTRIMWTVDGPAGQIDVMGFRRGDPVPGAEAVTGGTANRRDDRKAVRAEPVDGRMAYCVASPGEDPCAVLAFEYAKGGWATITASDRLSGAGRLGLLRVIAAGLRFDGAERVRMPFTLRGVPAGLPLQQVSMVSGDSMGAVGVRCSAFFNVDSGNLGPSGEAVGLGVAVTDEEPDSYRRNTTIGGRPAMVSRDEDGADRALVALPGGTYGSVVALDRRTQLLLSPVGGARGLAGNLAPVGDLGNEDTWTADWLR